MVENILEWYIVDEWLLFNVLSCQEQVTFRGDGDVRFVLDQQAPLDFHSASSLKQ